MVKFLIVFSLAIVHVWSSNFSKFGGGRMIGGDSAATGQFPYSVRISTNTCGSYSHLCGGAFIDRNWILTAAHCVHDSQCVIIILGVTDINSDDEEIEMVESEEVLIHPHWDQTTNVNDIALLKIPTVDITETIFPVPLPSNNNLAPIEYAYLSSWGSLDGSVIPERLQWTRLQIISNHECSMIYDEVTDDKLCAYPNANVKAYFGDSGSPLVLENTPAVVGILSVGSSNYLEPIVFTRVSHFLNWIVLSTGITNNIIP